MLGLGLSITASLLSSTAVLVPFNPLALFAINEPGIWFDPSDLTTLYQDNVGSTPVTAPSQTVGLMLDKSKGLTLGPELMPNGGPTFTNTTGWLPYQTGSNFSIVGGNLVAIDDCYFPITGLTAGKTYEVRYSVVSGMGLNLYVNADATGNAYIQNKQGVGSARFALVNPVLGIYLNANTTLASISVKELPGNHATQATAISRPTYGVVPVTGRRNLLTYTEAFNDSVWMKRGFSAPTTGETDPLGGSNAVSFLENNTDVNPAIYHTTAVSSAQQTFSVWLKSSVPTTVSLATNGLTSGGNISLTTAWQKFTVTQAVLNSAGPHIGGFGSITRASGIRVYVWYPQLELGSVATAYQRVSTQYDVTEAGVQSLSYLNFDGVNDFLQTSTNHPFTYTGAISAFFGFEKIGTTKTYETLFACGITGNSTTNQLRSMAFQTTDDGANRLATDIWAPAGVRGSTTLISPVKAVAAFNISNWSTHRSGGSAIKLNGSSQTVSAYGVSDPVGLNVSTMYIGVFDTVLATSFLAGNLYSLIIRGASSDAATITNTEIWVGGKTGINIVNNIAPTIFARDDTAVLDRVNSIIERRA